MVGKAGVLWGQWLAAVFSLWLGLSAPVSAQPLPVEFFSKSPTMSHISVSPSGRRLAWLEDEPTGGNNRLAVMDLDPIGQARVVKSFADARITSALWVNEDRLVLEAFQAGHMIYAGGAGTFAINHDGSDERQLISWRGGSDMLVKRRILPYGWFLNSTIDDGSADVMVYRRVKNSRGDLDTLELARLNTDSGLLKNLSHRFPPGVRNWLLDARQVPRLLSAYVEGRQQVYWRADAEAEWVKVADFDPRTESGIDPWFIDADGSVLVTARKGSDTEALYRADPGAQRLDPEPLARIPGFDLNPTKVVDSRSGRLVGLRYTTDRDDSYWFDAGLQAVQRALDAALPAGRSNRMYCGRCESTRFIVVRSSSDRQPGEFYLFDRSKSTLDRLGAGRPWIDENNQARRSLHRVKTRDGLSMPVYVTHPVAAAADQSLPTVVLVHGGPWVRGSDLGWEAEAQFLASRGYRVLQPEFRGSEGYGHAWHRAGWKAWGLSMQDDLADAVAWASKQGLTDASRVCVVGGSYGGYAALMGPISHPGVYRCAASFAGVTDIQLTYSITWSDFSESHKRYGMPVLVGDQVRDAAQLAATSPLLRVAEIKVPVLLGHGVLDRRVPVAHAHRFVSAAERAGVVVEEVMYRDEGHGFNEPANQADWYGRLERFLAKSLAAPR